MSQTRQDQVDGAAAGSRPPVAVEVFSDVICPWCYVGSRRLAAAVAEFAADRGLVEGWPVAVVWQPFELNPDMPVKGMDRQAYRSAKFGSWGRSQQLDAQVAEAGDGDGLVFRHDLMGRTPNTRAAHRLVWWAQQHGDGQEMVDRLFAGYFTDGLDVGDPDVLAGLAGEVGLDPGAAAEVVAASGELGRRAAAEVAAGQARAQGLGVSAVPFTIVGGRYAVSGAQPVQILVRALRLAAAEPDRDPSSSAAGSGAACTDGACR